jgi:hypothetical protein
MAGVDPESSPLFAKMRASVALAEEEEEERRRQDAGALSLEAAGGWEEHWDADARAVYYHSPKTGETRWDPPPELGGPDGQAQLGAAAADLDRWYYQGTSGEENGPQPLESMRQWFVHGYFPHGTMVRCGDSGPFKEVHEFPEICGIEAEIAEGDEGEEEAAEVEEVAAAEEGVPPAATGRRNRSTSLGGRLQAVAGQESSPSAVADQESLPSASPDTPLDHPTAGRAQRRSAAPSRAQRRRAGDDSKSELLSSQLSEEKARVSALQAELDELRQAHAEEKVQLQAELIQLERTSKHNSGDGGTGAVRQPCVAVFYEETPGAPSTAVPVSKAAVLVASAVIVDGTKVWAEGMHDWRPFREVKNQMGLGEIEAAAVAATFFYELGGSGEISEETPTKELERLLISLASEPGHSEPTGPTVNRATKVWTEGMATWKPLGQVEHLLMRSSD